MTTVTLPAGPILPWCIGAVNLTTCPDQNASYSAVDWTTICCDGTISDTTRVLADGSVNTTIDIFDLLCCGGDPLGGFDMTSCSSTITPTPLASLAATNTQNAMAWTDPQVGLTWSPYCVWLGSSTSVLKTTVTVSTFSAKALSTTSPIPTSIGSASPGVSTASGTTHSAPATASGGVHSASIPWRTLVVIGLISRGILLCAAG
jgi:hypothetical protein